MAANEAEPTPGKSPRVKVIKRSESKFDLMRLLNLHARSKGGSLHASGDGGFLQGLAAEMEAGRKNPIMVHGLRVQGMFGYVAAAMGQCTLVKEEDAGELYHEGDELLAPDYRVITRDGWEALIEVKNHHAAASEPFTLDTDYLKKLERYAAMMKKDLFFAVYWSRFGIWCLVPPMRFTVVGGKAAIRFEECFKQNEMARLGDTMIATLPPLQLRLHADRNQARTVGPNGETPFTIGAVELLCRGQVLTGQEAKIAWFLMLNGDWQEIETSVDVRDGLLNSTTMTSAPEDEAPTGQPFRQIGTLSRMISRQFNERTVEDGRVILLTPRGEPDTLGIIIPPDYSSSELPLWRFVQKPSGSPAPEAGT